MNYRLLRACAAHSWLCGIASLGLAQSVPPISAPGVASQESEVVNLAAFAVTGTSIRRIDAETALPVTTLSREQVDLAGGTTPIEFLQHLPAVGAMTINEGDAKSGVGARGDVAFINLRNLPSGNTLILTNGRRMVPHAISQATDGATGSGVGAPALSVNVNQLSQAAIDHVEVLRDGASAIYGSDASAGVVNTILARNLDGWSLRLRYSNSSKNDLNQAAFTIFGGKTFNHGKTNISLTLDNFQRESLRRYQRDYAYTNDKRPLYPAPWNGVPVAGVTNNQANHAPFSLGGNFRLGGVLSGVRPDGNIGISTTANNTDIMTLTTAGVFYTIPHPGASSTISSSAPSSTNPAFADNYSARRSAISIFPATARNNIVATLDHHLSDRLDLYGEFTFYQAQSQTYRDPQSISGSIDSPVAVPVNNPYNPFGSRFYDAKGAPNPDGTKRLVGTPMPVYISSATNEIIEFPNQIFQVFSRSYRILAGLKGKLGGTWRWDSGLLWSGGYARDTMAQGAVNLPNLRAALSRTGADAYNPFGTTFFIGSDNLIHAGPAYANPQAVIRSFITPGDQPYRWGRTGLGLVDFKANGDLLTLPGGTVAMAVGAEYRYEGYENNRSAGYLTAPVDPTNPYLNPPTAATANYVGQNSDIAIDDHRTVGSLFAELAIPVVGKKQNIPLFRQLDLSLAGRLERYSTVGSVAKPKFGATWAVNKWIHFRGSHSQSFLAPNMAETYPGYLYRFANTISDPYRYDVTRVNAVDGPGTTGRLDLRGGGQSLKPEKSKNSSLGVIISAPWIKGFTATIDVWKIQQSDAIAILGAQELLNRDQVALDAYVQGQLKSGKSIGQIDAGSGTSAYKGLNLINRATPNQDDLAVFAAWNATHSAALQRAPVGSVISIVDSFLNLAHREIKGADVELDYALPDSDRFGRFRINVAGSYTEKFMVQDTPGGAWTDYRWTNQALIPVPLWKGNATLSWSSKGRAWRMGVMASMQGTWQDRRLTTTSVVSQTLNSPDYISSNNLYIVPAQWYYNWFGSYRIHSPEHGFWGRLHNATLRAGINNVFDQKPALTGSSAPYETAGNILSIQGRTYYVEITKRL